MKKQQLDYILSKMLDSHDNVSDLNFTPGKPLQVESSGQLVTVNVEPEFNILTPFQTEVLALNLINNDRKLTETLLRGSQYWVDRVDPKKNTCLSWLLLPVIHIGGQISPSLSIITISISLQANPGQRSYQKRANFCFGAIDA